MISKQPLKTAMAILGDCVVRLGTEDTIQEVLNGIHVIGKDDGGILLEWYRLDDPYPRAIKLCVERDGDGYVCSSAEGDRKMTPFSEDPDAASLLAMYFVSMYEYEAGKAASGT